MVVAGRGEIESFRCSLLWRSPGQWQMAGVQAREKKVKRRIRCTGCLSTAAVPLVRHFCWQMARISNSFLECTRSWSSLDVHRCHSDIRYISSSVVRIFNHTLPVNYSNIRWIYLFINNIYIYCELYCHYQIVSYYSINIYLDILFRCLRFNSSYAWLDIVTLTLSHKWKWKNYSQDGKRLQIMRVHISSMKTVERISFASKNFFKQWDERTDWPNNFCYPIE